MAEKTATSKIPQTFWQKLQLWLAGHKKLLLLIIGCAVAAAVLFVLISAVLARAAINSFDEESALYKQRIETEVSQATKQIQNLPIVQPSDTTKAGEEVEKLQDKLRDVTSIPPGLSSVPLASQLNPKYDAAGHKRQAIIKTSESILNELTTIKQFMDYDRAVAENIKLISDMKEVKVDQFAEAENKWQQANEKLRSIKPPRELEGAHQQIIDTLQTSAPLWKNLSEAYQKFDAKSYNQIKDQINKQYENLRVQSGAFKKATQAHGDKLSQLIEKL